MTPGQAFKVGGTPFASLAWKVADAPVKSQPPPPPEVASASDYVYVPVAPAAEAKPPTAVDFTAADVVEGRVVLLDVREEVEWAEGHFASATPAPLSRIKTGVCPEDRHTGGKSARQMAALSSWAAALLG